MFAAIALSRHVQETTGISIQKFVKLLAPVKAGVILIDDVEHHLPAALTPEIEELITKLA